MKVQVKFSYIENEIPKKCRIPRDIKHDDGLVICNVKEVSALDAPVAITAKINRNFSDSSLVGYELQYRFYKNKLYTCVRMRSSEIASFVSGRFEYDNPALPETIDITDYKYNQFDIPTICGSKYEVKRTILNSMKNHLVIDGVFYRRVCEPCYRVCIFGLGRNHGGTALMTDVVMSKVKNPWLFSLLQKNEALAEATAVASGRGDSKSLPMTVNGYDYQVLLPQAIQLNRILP